MLSSPQPGLSIAEQVEIAVTYVEKITAGGIDERYLADDMAAWSLTMRRVPRSRYWPRLQRVRSIFTEPSAIIIDRTTAEPNCVVVQARSSGTLFTGDHYSTDYLFQIEFDEEGRIRHV